MGKKRKPDPSLLSQLLAAQQVAVHGKPARKKGLPRTKTTFRCITCSESITTLAGCDRHSQKTGHLRIEQVLHPEDLAR